MWRSTPSDARALNLSKSPPLVGVPFDLDGFSEPLVLGLEFCLREPIEQLLHFLASGHVGNATARVSGPRLFANQLAGVGLGATVFLRLQFRRRQLRLRLGWTTSTNSLLWGQETAGSNPAAPTKSFWL